jgi:hypothetical protein
MGAPTTYKGKQFGRDLGRISQLVGLPGDSGKAQKRGRLAGFRGQYLGRVGLLVGLDFSNCWQCWGGWLVCLPRWLPLLLVGQMLI